MMDHKAYAFNWNSFESDLHALLLAALGSGAVRELEHYIDANRKHLTDPYEGDPLPDDWRDMLENCDVHEIGDFALTRFYDPSDNRGLSDAWLGLTDVLPEAAQVALLGTPLGPPDCEFDPGKMGSYFQTPAEVSGSLEALAACDLPALSHFRQLLQHCAQTGLGVYVTF